MKKEQEEGNRLMKKFATAWRIWLVGLLAGLMALALGSSPVMAAGPITMKIAIPHAGSDRELKVNKGLMMKKRIEELTKGAVKVEVFRGELGGEKEIMSSTQTGTIQACVISAGTVGGFVKEAEIFNMPFLFENTAHLYKVMDGAYGRRIKELLQKAGFRLVITGFDAPRMIFLREKEVKTLADLKGLKIRVMETPLFVDLMKAMDAVPAPMSWSEVFMALSNGVVDGLDSSWPGAWASKLKEVTKYTFATSHVLTPQFAFISQRWFMKQPKEIQAAITQACKDVELGIREFDEQEVKVFEKMWVDAGQIIHVPNEADMKTLRAIGAKVTESFYDRIGKKNVELIRNSK